MNVRCHANRLSGHPSGLQAKMLDFRRATVLYFCLERHFSQTKRLDMPTFQYSTAFYITFDVNNYVFIPGRPETVESFRVQCSQFPQKGFCAKQKKFFTIA